MASDGAEPMQGVEGDGAGGSGEDPVVATYPVYLQRGTDPGGALYLLQSPLRPAGRPYELEACEEVRFKVRGARVPPRSHRCASPQP